MFYPAGAPEVWLAAYKADGQRSYVWNDKEVYHRLLLSRTATNDLDICTEALEAIVSTPSLADNTALWFSQIYGITNRETFSQLTDMASITQSDAAIHAIFACPAALAVVKQCANVLNLLVTSDSAMTAVASSDTAMNQVIADTVLLDAVAGSAVAISAMTASAVAMSKVAASPTAMDKVIATPAFFDSVAGSAVAVSAVTASAIAMNKVAASPTAMDKVIATPAFLNAVTVSATAMEQVAASSNAMSKVAASPTAMTAVLGSSTAITALKSSPLIVTKEQLTAYGQYWDEDEDGTNYGTFDFRGIIIATTAGNKDNAFTIRSVDSTIVTTDCQTRNAATAGDKGWYDFIVNQTPYCNVRSGITYWAYYSSTKMQYIPT